MIPETRGQAIRHCRLIVSNLYVENMKREAWEVVRVRPGRYVAPLSGNLLHGETRLDIRDLVRLSQVVLTTTQSIWGQILKDTEANIYKNSPYGVYSPQDQSYYP